MFSSSNSCRRVDKFWFKHFHLDPTLIANKVKKYKFWQFNHGVFSNDDIRMAICNCFLDECKNMIYACGWPNLWVFKSSVKINFENPLSQGSCHFYRRKNYKRSINFNQKLYPSTILQRIITIDNKYLPNLYRSFQK